MPRSTDTLSTFGLATISAKRWCECELRQRWWEIRRVRLFRLPKLIEVHFKKTQGWKENGFVKTT